MIRPILAAVAFASPAVLISCAQTESNPDAAQNPRAFPFGKFDSNVPLAPKISGYTQVPSRSTAMRDAVIDHPSGKWTYSFDVTDDARPITITAASGKSTRLAGAYYPEEGGADAAGVFAFVKGDETLIVLQGTSDFTYEETQITFQGDTLVRAKKYAVKGNGMGEGAPGVAPKHAVYPPN